MQLPTIFTIAAVLTLGSAVRVSWDAGYDDANRSLLDVACSDGLNGLMTRYGWEKQSDVPNFANIGGFQQIAGWNSASCGTCFELSFQGTKLFVLAVDHAGDGANISKTAMNTLTKNQADNLGAVDATVKVTDKKNCGI